jgi:hypothetical protein
MTSYSNECAFCFDNLNTSDIAILNCPHRYHLACIQKWNKCSKQFTKVCPQCNVKGEIINVIVNKKEEVESPLLMDDIVDNAPVGLLDCCTIL